MQLLRRLLRQSAPKHLTRGLSTAELVGIIVIVGILGALGGTYVNGLVSQANTNAGTQNANSINTVVSSVLAAGGTLNKNAPAATDGGNGILDVDTSAHCLDELNQGVTVMANGNPVLYKMTPPISAAAMTAGSYTMTVDANGKFVTFSYNPGDAP